MLLKSFLSTILEPVPDYVKGSVDTVIKISRTERSGDVLLFLTGHEEVETAVRLLKDYAQNALDSSRTGKEKNLPRKLMGIQ